MREPMKEEHDPKVCARTLTGNPVDSLTAAANELTCARLAVNDWHACATMDELSRWRAAQMRLIVAAKASVYPEVEALRADVARLTAERDRLQLAAMCARDNA